MKNNIEQKSSAFLFPDKIIIETMYKKNEGTWYGSGLITILPLDTSDFELGKNILNAATKTKHEDISYEKIKDYWKELIKKAGYKTEKSFLQNVKKITITIDNDNLRLEPFQVKMSDKMLYRISAAITEIIPTPEPSVIGREIRKNWGKCLFID